MSLEELGHAERPDVFLAEDWDHVLVWLEVLLVLGVLELVLLDVGPELLNDLGPGQHLALLGAQHGRQLRGERQRLGQSGS